MTVETEVTIAADPAVNRWPLRRLVVATFIATLAGVVLISFDMAQRMVVEGRTPAPVHHTVRFEMLGDGVVQATQIWIRSGTALAPAPGVGAELTSQGLPVGLDLKYPTAGAALFQVRSVKAAGCQIVVDGAVEDTQMASDGRMATCLWVDR